MVTGSNAIQYRQFIYRTENSDSVRDGEDSVLIAYSTMPQPIDVKSIRVIHTIKQNNYVPPEITMHRMWLHDILDDNNIPYLVEMASTWLGRRRHGQVQFIYVRKADKEKALELKKEFRNAPMMNHLDMDEGCSDYDDDNHLLQVECKFCSKEFDCDYGKCPYCKKRQ